MASWAEVLRAAPELAAAVQGRFDAYGLGLLATLRRDGAPRISGVEPLFAGGELWLGMMPGSLKAKDLFRDGRFALHNATTDKQVTEGDARVSGVARAVQTEPELDYYKRVFEEHTGYSPGAGEFLLFRGDVREISMIRPGGNHLDIDWWREDAGLRHVDRY
jgi:hypothetical protein